MCRGFPSRNGPNGALIGRGNSTSMENSFGRLSIAVGEAAQYMVEFLGSAGIAETGTSVVEKKEARMAEVIRSSRICMMGRVSNKTWKFLNWIDEAMESSDEFKVETMWMFFAQESSERWEKSAFISKKSSCAKCSTCFDLRQWKRKKKEKNDARTRHLRLSQPLLTSVCLSSLEVKRRSICNTSGWLRSPHHEYCSYILVLEEKGDRSNNSRWSLTLQHQTYILLFALNRWAEKQKKIKVATTERREEAILKNDDHVRRQVLTATYLSLDEEITDRNSNPLVCWRRNYYPYSIHVGGGTLTVTGRSTVKNSAEAI